MSAAEAMNANGTAVARTFLRINGMYRWPVLSAIAAEIKTTLTTLSAVAAITTLPTSAPTPSLLIGAISTPAASATSARTATL